MDRRTYLERLTALGTVTALAGCTEQTLEDAKEPSSVFDERYDEEEVDLPVEREFDVVAEGIERAEGATFENPEGFEEYLLESGIAVESIEEKEEDGETLLELEYVREETIEEGNARSLGVVAGGYAALVRGEYDGDELKASLLDPDGQKFGEFEIKTEWAEAYDEGEKTAATYGGKVLHTLESRRSA